MSKRTKLCLKILVSLVILCILLFTINIDDCKKVISLVDVKNLFLLVLIYIVGQIVSALKWKIIAKKLGFQQNIFEFIKYYFKGMFYNSFLPTNVGGDVMKIIYLKDCNNLSQSVEKSFVSVLFDRLSGVFMLICMAFVALFFLSGLYYVVKYSVIVAFFSVLVGCCVIIFLSKSNYNFKNVILKKVVNYTNIFSDKSLLPILFLSLVFHLLVIFIHILIGKDLQLAIPIQYYFILYPLSAIAASLPISLNGIGIKEAAYIYLLSLIGISSSSAIVFALCWNVVIIFSSFLGAVFFIKKIR